LQEDLGFTFNLAKDANNNNGGSEIQGQGSNMNVGEIKEGDQ